MAALMAVAAIALAPPAHAAALGLGMKETPDDTWMTNGNVYTQVLYEDGRTLYVGGKFTQVREKPASRPGKTLAVDNLAAIDVATGAPSRRGGPA